MSRSSRRALLAAAPVLALAACGSSTPDEQTQDPNVDLGTQKEGDVALLNELLAGDVPDADTAAALQQAVRTLGGRPGEAATGDDRGADATQRAYALYLDAIPKLADGRLRELCAGFLADRAARLAELRVAARANAVPEAFVT